MAEADAEADAAAENADADADGAADADADADLPPAMEIRVGHKYRLGRKIGSGSFSDIYLGTDMTTGEEVAVKIEPASSQHLPIAPASLKRNVRPALPHWLQPLSV